MPERDLRPLSSLLALAGTVWHTGCAAKPRKPPLAAAHWSAATARLRRLQVPAAGCGARRRCYEVQNYLHERGARQGEMSSGWTARRAPRTAPTRRPEAWVSRTMRRSPRRSAGPRRAPWSPRMAGFPLFQISGRGAAGALRPQRTYKPSSGIECFRPRRQRYNSPDSA